MGVFGGTFDPIHQGHLRTVASVQQQLGLAQVLFLVALVYSAIWGKKAEQNPWKANTLEWTLPSPPAHGNFHPDLPTVYRGPYEYNSDLVEEDYLPQDRKLETAGTGSDEEGASGEGAA